MNFEQEKGIDANQEKLEEISKRSKQFILISGPSGSGKTMVIKHLVDNYGFFEPPFLTTRELRPGELEIGGAHLDQEDFAKRETNNRIFLSAHNYGNSYGYDVDVILQIATSGKNIVVEANPSNLSNYVVNFLPQSMVIGMLPSTVEEAEERLAKRGLNDHEDIKKRLVNFDKEKDCIVRASALININQIVPVHGVPHDTLSQVDQLMAKNGFNISE